MMKTTAKTKLSYMDEIALNTGQFAMSEKGKQQIEERTANTMRTYELYYNDGGHGGPFYNLRLAREQAERTVSGSPWTTRIEIRPSSSNAIGGYGNRNRGSYYIERDNAVMLCIP